MFGLLPRELGRSVKFAFYLAIRTIRGKIFFWGKCYFDHFWTLNQKFSAFRRKTFGLVVKNVFYVSNGTFSGKFFFEKKFDFFFVLVQSTKIFWPLDENFSAGLS